jgi:hypothetical protein
VEDLARWLGAQLDTDAEKARAACWDEQSDVWTARPPQASYERYTVVDYCDDGVVVVTPENADADGVGQHVAEWDPARVLREIDAKRRIIAEHALNGWVCTTCDNGEVEQVFPCPTLRLLAVVYADREGYREEWAP